MFGDFARSAEAVFSRWAIKRICKFLLKKKLGDLILGDIDLDQLDVQLGQGTIQLSDLALNVDYLNQKVRQLFFCFSFLIWLPRLYIYLFCIVIICLMENHAICEKGAVN